MFDKTDPGSWMIAILVACVHLTVVVVKKCGGEPQWNRLGWVPVCFLVASPGLFSDHLFPIIVGAVFLGCGVVLSVKHPSKDFAWLAPMAGIFGFWLMVNWYDQYADSRRYMDGKFRWTDGVGPQALILAMLDNHLGDSNPKTSFSLPGFLDEDRFSQLGGQSSPEFRGPFTLKKSTPLWHTFFTDIGDQTVHTYRIWLPAKPIPEALSSALFFEDPTLSLSPTFLNPAKGIRPGALPTEVAPEYRD